ncbi:MAG: response regulator receiver protein [Gemmatimonadetes bacterium]|nr:response regulator receiver protein [Gemmatimonadota bacterium]
MTTPRRRILIVDDEILMVRTLSDILRMRGWDVHGVHAGEEALAFLRSDANAVDIVLMDVRMGGMTGVDALKQIREERPGLPVMLMTAYSTTELLAEAERQGAVRILSKPLLISGLLEMLETIADPPRRVLVVDDNHAYLASLADIIQSHGYVALRADSLSVALRLLAERSPGVVLLDMRLDGVNPETSVLAIRRVDPSVNLILYSGSEASLREGESSDVSRDVYATLRKPFAPEKLVAMLGDIFDG